MKFKDIPGLSEVKERLVRTVTENRISHAQLFLGMEGSANLALAMAYAQFINCENKLPNDSCGECPSCIKFQKLAHPDMHYVFPVAKIKEVKDKEVSSNNRVYLEKWRNVLLEKDYHLSLSEWYETIGVENKVGYINTEDARSILDKLSYKSYEGEYKIMLIWMTEYLYHAAAPRLLKVMEEPPEKTLFLLVANQSDKIINTILSRAQTVKVPRYQDADLEKYYQEKYALSGEQLEHTVRLAHGSLIAGRDVIQSSETEQFNFEQFRSWMRMCFTAKFIDINDFVVMISRKGRERQKSFLGYGLEMFRKAILMNYAGPETVRLSPVEETFLKNFAPFVNEINLEALYEEFNNAIYHIERNAKADILFTDLSIRTTKLLHAGKK